MMRNNSKCKRKKSKTLRNVYKFTESKITRTDKSEKIYTKKSGITERQMPCLEVFVPTCALKSTNVGRITEEFRSTEEVST